MVALFPQVIGSVSRRTRPAQALGNALARYLNHRHGPDISTYVL